MGSDPNVLSRRCRGRPGRDAGVVTTELAMLMPFLVLIGLVAVFAVQVVRHDSRAQAAADAAARAASLYAGSEAEGTAAAAAAADSVCRGTIDVLRIEWRPPVAESFTPGAVVVDLTCTEPVRGFGPLRRDGVRSSSASAVAVLEYWRPGA